MKNKFHKAPRQRFSDVEALESRLAQETPKSGDYLYDYRIDIIKQENPNDDEQALAKKLKITFKDLPLSSETIAALTKRRFFKLTEIQRCVIPHALAGRDVLAASKTGSGKTLSYLVPIIENLYRKKWTPMDGPGALVVVPTRELALQVFEVARSLLEAHHELSFGLVIGGKSLEDEQRQIGAMNLLICTPGRLLQHLQETENFDLDNLQVLVLDEADEILSLGFQGSLTEILNSVPREAQTLLFSATLSKKLIGLSKVALKDPENIFLQNKGKGEEAARIQISNVYETPLNLRQFAMLVPHEEKIDVLFSFLRAHKQSKTIVFVSCCKQARFIYEAFRRIKLGLPIFELQGRQKQPKRMAIYFAFGEKRRAVLLTTNVAARGLDFPRVDWVVQFDLPENIETYVHRAGRTARFTAAGKSLALVDPSEEKFLGNLASSGIKVDRILPNPGRQLTIRATLQILCSEDNELKYLAQRAFISFLKNVHYMADKRVFDLRKVKHKQLAESYGLVQTPVIKIGNDKGESQDEESNEEMEEGRFKNDSQANQRLLKQENKRKKAIVVKEEKIQTGNENQNEAVEREIHVESKKLNKSAKKLLKFKEKLRLKKQSSPANAAPNLQGKEGETHLSHHINSRLNQTRETQLIKRAEKIIHQEKPLDDSQDFLVVKRKNEQIDIEKMKENPWKVSNRQLKKIKPDGLFSGRNVFEISKEGHIFSQAEREGAELRKTFEQNEIERNNFVPILAIKLAANEDIDRDIAVSKAKEKKAKEKMAKKFYREEKRKSFKRRD